MQINNFIFLTSSGKICRNFIIKQCVGVSIINVRAVRNANLSTVCESIILDLGSCLPWDGKVLDVKI
jgi:hypothetical protein